MAVDFSLKVGTQTTHESSGASAANLTAVLATTILDNSASLDELAAAELVAGFAAAPTLPAGVELYLVPALDGTNYAEANTAAGASYLSPAHFKGVFSLVQSQTGAQRLTVPAFPLEPRKYRLYLLNRTGQTLSAGWTLKTFGVRRQGV